MVKKSMSSETENTGSGFDTALLFLALGVLAASITGFYYFQDQANDLVRVLGMLAGGALAIVIAMQTGIGRTAWGYIQGSRIELRRVVWPTRKETLQTTLMIMVVVLILALFLWGLDALLLWAMKLLTGRG